MNLLVSLDLIADLEVLELLKAHTALSALTHFHDIFLDVFQGFEFT